MKNIIKPIISLLLVIIIVMTSACTKGDGGETTKAPEATKSPDVETQDDNMLTLISDAENDYKLIRGTYAPEVEVAAATSIYTALRNKYSEIMDDRLYTDDWIKGVGKNEIYEGDEFEIVVGYTNRKESRDVYAELSADEYIIRVVGNKIIIIGYDEYSTSSAATEFVNKYVSPADDGALKIPKDLNIKGKAELRKVAINAEASYRVMTWNLGGGKGVEEDAIEIILRYLPDILCLQEANKGVHQDVVAKLRREIPDIVIRTTLIVGFPGETEEDFAELCEYVKEAIFDRLGCFTYSREEDTPAYDMPDQIDEQLKNDRMDIIMREQLTINEENNRKMIGKTIRVLCEDYDAVGEIHFGRSAADAPEIDGKVYFKSEQRIAAGSFVDVKVRKVLDYDLIGVAVLKNK